MVKLEDQLYFTTTLRSQDHNQTLKWKSLTLLFGKREAGLIRREIKLEISIRDSMKILIITQYFYPENLRINDLSFSLQKKGHDISVLTAKPNYPKGKIYTGYSFFTKGFESEVNRYEWYDFQSDGIT